MEGQQVVVVRRDTGEKIKGVGWSTLAETVHTILEEMQENLLRKATQIRDASLTRVSVIGLSNIFKYKSLSNISSLYLFCLVDLQYMRLLTFVIPGEI